MKILITGVTGFVGSSLFKYLVDTNCSPKALNLRIPNWKAEVNLDATAIIHLAGKAHDLKNTANSEVYFEVNTTLPQDVFDTFLESQCRDFIFLVL